MKYLYLISTEAEEQVGGHLTEGVGKGGLRIVSHRRKPVQTTPVGPIREGKVLSTDGPFAETKE